MSYIELGMPTDEYENFSREVSGHTGAGAGALVQDFT